MSDNKARDELKQLPPFKFPVKYSSLGTYINDADDKMIADVRGWGWIQKLDKPEDKQDALGRFIADAINEKLLRLTDNQERSNP